MAQRAEISKGVDSSKQLWCYARHTLRGDDNAVYTAHQGGGCCLPRAAGWAIINDHSPKQICPPRGPWGQASSSRKSSEERKYVSGLLGRNRRACGRGWQGLAFVIVGFTVMSIGIRRAIERSLAPAGIWHCAGPPVVPRTSARSVAVTFRMNIEGAPSLLRN